MILQVLLGTLLSAFFAVKVYWTRIKAFLVSQLKTSGRVDSP